MTEDTLSSPSGTSTVEIDWGAGQRLIQWREMDEMPYDIRVVLLLRNDDLPLLGWGNLDCDGQTFIHAVHPQYNSADYRPSSFKRFAYLPDGSDL